MEIISTLGIGTYGSVYRISHKERPGYEYALKVMLRSMGSFSTFMRTSLRELWLGARFVPYSGILASQGGSFFGGIQRLGICSLAEVTPLSLSQLRLLGHQVATQLNVIHEDGIIHHDVKPQNIIVYNETTAALVDFSLSMRIKQSYDADVVTMWWRPPEILMGIPHTNKSDVWSLGVTMLNSINIKPVIIADTNATPEQMLQKIVSVLGTRDFRILEKRLGSVSTKTTPVCKCDETLNDLLEMMLQTDPDKRASMQQVIEHPFWSGPKENLTSLGTCESSLKLEEHTKKSIQAARAVAVSEFLHKKTNGASLTDRIEAFELFVDAAVFFNMNVSVVVTSLYVWDTIALACPEAIRAAFFAASCVDTDKDLGINDICERMDYTSQMLCNENVVRAVVHAIPQTCGLCPYEHIQWVERDRARLWMFVSSLATWTSAEAKHAWLGSVSSEGWTNIFRPLLAHKQYREGTARHDLYLL